MKRYMKLIVSVLVFFIGLYFLLNFVGGGAIRMWLVNNFFYEDTYEYEGIVYHSTLPYWDKIYLLILVLVIIGSILFLGLWKYQVEARSTNSGGAGLGLAIAKEIIQAHGGTIAAQSSMQETVFIVKLPIKHI